MKKLSKKVPKKTVSVRPRSKPSPRNNSVAGSDDRLRVIFTEKQIHKRVSQIAGQLNHDLQGRTLHVIGILENCFLFMADLVRGLNVPVVCHFLKAETSDSLSGAVAVRQILYTPRVDVTGKDVLLVDGILQSGLTLDHLVRVMSGQNPSSLRTAVLIEKPDEKKVDVPTDYLGFKTQEKFLVGYGLGYQELYRNLRHIASRTSA